MGTTSSSLQELATNEYLHKLVGKESISVNDPFWNRLLSFSFTPPMKSSEHKLLDEKIKDLYSQLLVNNLQSGNYGSLLHVFLRRVPELTSSTVKDDNILVWQTYNALFILRCISKYFVESIKEDDVLRQLESQVETIQKECGVTHGYSQLELFLNALVQLIVDLPTEDFTYALRLEAINTLLVILSIQLFAQRPADKSPVYRCLFQGKCSIHACVLMKTLLQHFTRLEKLPDSLQKGHGGSIMIGLASELWNMLTFGMGRGGGGESSAAAAEGETNSSESPLAVQSLLLILVLSNHCTNERSLSNPYRQALFCFTNSQEPIESIPTQSPATFKFDYSQLYQTLCQTLCKDETTLLLYLLLHKNQNFKTYIMARSDIEQLVIPVLKTLYNAPESSSHHIYMSLIILLILSEDDLFNKTVHETGLKSVAWYTERSISEISLGGLLVLVVIRTVQYNMLKMRDKYLHTNCLAALANMSGQFRGLHPYVSQRLVSLFETLARKHARLVEQIRQTSVLENCSEDDVDSELVQDLAVLEEVLRMVLEILNSCLSSQLTYNPNLIYTLLYKRDVFEPFQTHPAFQDITQNIDRVITYFSSRLEQQQQQEIGVSEVLMTIQHGALQWPTDRLKKFPDLKFKYVEENQPEEFFIPYVWSLVCQSSGLYWNPANIKLFSPDS